MATSDDLIAMAKESKLSKVRVCDVCKAGPAFQLNAST